MADTTFKINCIEELNVTHIEISGPIDESAAFNEFRRNGSVRIDLRGVTRINSVGMRAWCLWLQKFREPTDVILINCPVVMAKNFTSIRGFLTDRCRVYSFIIPYYSEATDERREFLATWGKEFSKGTLKLPELKDSKGNPMVLDVPDSYFRFLKP